MSDSALAGSAFEGGGADDGDYKRKNYYYQLIRKIKKKVNKINKEIKRKKNDKRRGRRLVYCNNQNKCQKTPRRKRKCYCIPKRDPFEGLGPDDIWG